MIFTTYLSVSNMALSMKTTALYATRSGRDGGVRKSIRRAIRGFTLGPNRCPWEPSFLCRYLQVLRTLLPDVELLRDPHSTTAQDGTPYHGALRPASSHRRRPLRRIQNRADST